MPRLVRDVMTAEPKMLSSTATLAEAARVMRQNDIGDVLVEENGKAIGIVTDRDIVVRGIAAGKNPAETPLSDIYSKDLCSVAPTASVDEALRIMREQAIRRVAVIEDGATVGVLSLGDIAAIRDQKSVLGQVSAAPPNK
jgi:CBS domain-containing protein